MNIQHPARNAIEDFLRKIQGFVNGVALQHRVDIDLVYHCAVRNLSRAQTAGQATAPTTLLRGTDSHGDNLYAAGFESRMRVRSYSGIGNQYVDFRYRAYQRRTYHRNLA